MVVKRRRRAVKRRRKAGQPDWDSRYADNWRKICAIAHQATGGICCCCLVARSEIVHHVRYRDKRGAIAGREVAGRDVFSLCVTCHNEQAHSKKNWIRCKIDPLLGNHNTSAFVKKLKFGYQLLSSAIR
jgi:hypothetical protein